MGMDTAGVHDSSNHDPTEALHAQAARYVLDLCLDEALSAVVAGMDESGAAPWLLCYAAMEQRLQHANAANTLRLAQAAFRTFAQQGDVNGQARACGSSGCALPAWPAHGSAG
jgi:hypothetical protein